METVKEPSFKVTDVVYYVEVSGSREDAKYTIYKSMVTKRRIIDIVENPQRGSNDWSITENTTIKRLLTYEVAQEGRSVSKDFHEWELFSTIEQAQHFIEKTYFKITTTLA